MGVTTNPDEVYAPKVKVKLHLNALPRRPTGSNHGTGWMLERLTSRPLSPTVPSSGTWHPDSSFESAYCHRLPKLRGIPLQFPDSFAEKYKGSEDVGTGLLRNKGKSLPNCRAIHSRIRYSSQSLSGGTQIMQPRSMSGPEENSNFCPHQKSNADSKIVQSSAKLPLWYPHTFSGKMSILTDGPRSIWKLDRGGGSSLSGLWIFRQTSFSVD